MAKKILFIQNEKRIRYGAHYINDLIIQKLRKKGYAVTTIFPQESIEILSTSLAGIKNILFFYSLISKKNEIENYDLIQGTTFTTLPFLNSGVPVVSHFGSTTYGFLKKVPSIKKLQAENEQLPGIFEELKRHLKINGKSASIKSLQDISDIEMHVAKKSDLVIATSEKVKKDLIKKGIHEEKIAVVHNAIEDYWFRSKVVREPKKTAQLVYLGRMGDDIFTVKLKGVNRLIFTLKKFPELDKKVIGMCSKFEGYQKLFSNIPKTEAYLSAEKKKIPSLLKENYADIFINPSRYEGFCLSLVEAMSQGLVPVTFPVGIAPEIIKNGKNGYVVHNLEEMAEKINHLKENRKSRVKMAENAIITSKLFKADYLIEKLSRLYDPLIRKRKEVLKAKYRIIISSLDAPKIERIPAAN